MIKSWTYKNEYKILRKSILKSVDKSLKSGQIFFGKEINKLEKNFNKKYKFKFGVAVGSGTDALYISMLALGIGKGDEIITVSNTAIPTISAIISTGATPVFVDVSKDYLIDTKKITAAITKKTKGIIPVHLYGQACNMNKIIQIARKNKLKVIEDCAQAQGAKFKNKYVGTFGISGCFSFYPTKILGGYGDGGYIGTNNKDFYQKVRAIRFYGIDQINKKNKFINKYYSNIHGINSRIDEIQCSILNLKLPKVDSYIKKRNYLAKIYRRELKNTNLYLPPVNNNCKHVYHLFVVYHKNRNLIFKEFKKYKIKLNINYPFPVHNMKGYKKFTKKNVNLMNTNKLSKGIFSLPMYPTLQVKELLVFTRILIKILNKLKI